MLNTCNIANKNEVNTVNLIETLENEQFSNFVNSCLRSSTKILFDPIRKIKLPIFSQATTKRTLNNQVTTIKKTVQLFSQLYIACQIRDGSLDEFFSHENQSFSLSWSKNGDLRSGIKSDILTRLKDIHPCYMLFLVLFLSLLNCPPGAPWRLCALPIIDMCLMHLHTSAPTRLTHH